MSDVLIDIEANLRKGTGKGIARKLRNNGKIPANLMDKGKSTSIELSSKLLDRAYASKERKFNLLLNGESKVVYIKELQIDAVKRIPLHVDLMLGK
ncbi:MAG: hypothetical protein HQK54_01220 [Oligoflexales bacterium]|nr:hypothetical protein [Oligoflexales bacterium]